MASNPDNSVVPRAECTQEKGGAAEIDGDAPEASGDEAGVGAGGWYGHEGAAKMADALEPAVLNFQGEENAAGTEYAEDFGEGAVLELAAC